jgi:acetylornithine deacetylase/succinyl-diaminopimelate desuccinylase-like protein
MPVSRQAGRICGPGIGDNSLGVAALLGLAWLLRETPEPLESDIWFVANTCEEGLGDLRGMKAVVDRFGDRVRAYLVLEGTALCQIYHRAVGVQRYRVTINTPGGHSWTDYGLPSAVHELAALITGLTGLPLPARPRTTMNVGTIRGGTGINVLASQAQFDLDLRSESADVLAKLCSEVQEKMVDRRRIGVDVQLESIGQRPAGQIPPDHPLVQLAAECLAQEGIEPSLTSGSTDANIPLSRGIPAVVLGITTGTGAHTEQECIDLAPAPHGMSQLVNLVRRLSKSQ